MSNKKIVLDNVTAKFVQELEKSKAPPIYTMELQDARSFFDHAQAIVHGQQFPVSQEDITIATDTVANTVNNIYVTLFRPQHTIEPLPIIVYFHGGGWILGNKESFKRLACEIAFKSNAAVAFVNYSPAPETQYPTQIHQAYAATLYFARHGHKHNLDPRRLAIAGDSVGGNMAAVVAILANQQKEPMIQLQVLFYPVTDGSMSSQSYNQFADGPWLTKKAMEWFWDAYCPDKAQRLNFTASPLNATPEQLQGLPPTLLITDENDVLRDEGEAYAHRLMQAGVSVTALRYLGVIHDFVFLNALQHSPAQKSAIAVATSMLRQVFYPENL